MGSSPTKQTTCAAVFDISITGAAGRILPLVYCRIIPLVNASLPFPRARQRQPEPIHPHVQCSRGSIPCLRPVARTRPGPNKSHPGVGGGGAHLTGRGLPSSISLIAVMILMVEALDLI